MLLSREKKKQDSLYRHFKDFKKTIIKDVTDINDVLLKHDSVHEKLFMEISKLENEQKM